MKDYETQSLLIIIKFVLVFIKTKKKSKIQTLDYMIYTRIYKSKRKKYIYTTLISKAEICYLSGHCISNPNVYIQDVTEVTSFCT